MAGEYGDAIKLRIAAPAADQKANRALVAYLSAILKAPQNKITIISGGTSRDKVVQIEGLDARSIRLALLAEARC